MHRYEDFNLAIDFAVTLDLHETQPFLKAWRAGDWSTLDRGWDDWKSFVDSRAEKYVPFPKIPRLKRGCIITEKIDGTNAQIVVGEDGSVRAGSRNRWITPDNDNFGFAAWVQKHTDELRELGVGRHFGEWWGLGIQRGYDLKERRFSLFNAGRWSNDRPACCGVVPVLYAGDFSTTAVDETMTKLVTEGSVAAPGFAKPEGVIVFLTAASHTYKVLAENDNEPKREREAA